ncbi:MAG: ATPase,transcriptional regulator, luxR family [Mycobacterium sp.]|nr:ATPase,transcriptional regulator, luxR family [Mycobacterium sp.]
MVSNEVARLAELKIGYPYRVVERPTESHAVADFLRSAETHPSVLVIEGEPGIGKTTLWRAATGMASERGFRVFDARAEQGGGAYAAVADLLAGVQSDQFDLLPAVQRIALDRVLHRVDDRRDDPPTDERVVASAFLALADQLTPSSPVLVAIDDAQWLDPSSRAVVAFAVRRLRGRIGILIAERTDTTAGQGAAWLRLTSLLGVQRIRLGPFETTGLRAVLAGNLDRTFSRTAMTRIAELSGGNPFYALELARAMGDRPLPDDVALPESLAELVGDRLGRLDQESQDMLFAAAAAGTPTVDLLARVTDRSAHEVVDRLEAAETEGIVVIDGNRVRFTHPLLARGAYDLGGPQRRRAMHAALSRIVEHPEPRARHLALAATAPDPATLGALDDAAARARRRGAPAAAAELLDLAVTLDSTDPHRRIRAADHHFRAGDADRARHLLVGLVDELPACPLRARALIQLARVHVYDDSFAEAARLAERAVAEGDADAATTMASLTLLAFTQFHSGAAAEALESIAEALRLADRVDDPSLTSQALAMRVTIDFHLGRGVDHAGLRRALELEDRDADALFALRASAVNVFIQGWIGNLAQAAAAAEDLRRRCTERGAENDLMAMTGHATLIEIWRGDLAKAQQLSDETMQRAEMAGGDLIWIIALTLRATVAAHTGRIDEARSDAREAIALAQRGDAPHLAAWPTLAMAAAEVSVTDYEAALTAARRLIDGAADLAHAGDVVSMWFVPDAVEALVAVGRADDALPLIEALEANGRRLDRPRLLATGARCRAMWFAAHRELPSAVRSAQEAMAHHDRLPMPFDRARTQLLLGRLQRRQRQAGAARDTLGAALREFERMGAAAWADRARAELANGAAPGPAHGLSPSERRVAELAVNGMSNRDLAQALSISLKTVEANLTQIYRKLGIRSRAQLAQRIGSPPQ